MAKETILRCDECDTEIKNGRFLVMSADSHWYTVLKFKRHGEKKLYDFGTARSVPPILEYDLCSEGCLVKFEAKLREKL